MSIDFGVTLTRGISVARLVARTRGLFAELVGFDGEVLETVFYPSIDDLTGERGSQAPLGEYEQYEVGSGHPSFVLELTIGHRIALASISAHTNLDPPGTSEARVIIGAARTAPSIALGVCGTIAVAELAEGVIDEHASYLVDCEEIDAATAIAALRRSRVTSEGLEERARQLLRPLPGFRDFAPVPRSGTLTGPSDGLEPGADIRLSGVFPTRWVTDLTDLRVARLHNPCRGCARPTTITFRRPRGFGALGAEKLARLLTRPSSANDSGGHPQEYPRSQEFAAGLQASPTKRCLHRHADHRRDIAMPF